MKIPKKFFIALYILGTGLSFNLGDGLINEVSAVTDVCPEGNGWIKIEPLSGYTYTYTPSSGYFVTDNCYKHATYVHYGSGNTIVADYHPEGCNLIDDYGDNCIRHEISHASFKEKPTPTVSPSPSPSPSVSPSPSPSPSPTPTVSPSPTVTPSPSITPTPETNTKSTLSTVDPSCESDQVTASHTVKKDDKGQNGIRVVFIYNGAKNIVYTDSNGYAGTSFTYTGDGYVDSNPDGYSSAANFVTKETDCGTERNEEETTTTSVGGQVLGATTDPELYAEAGVTTDILMAIMGISGVGLTTTGIMLNGRKNS